MTYVSISVFFATKYEQDSTNDRRGKNLMFSVLFSNHISDGEMHIRHKCFVLHLVVEGFIFKEYYIFYQEWSLQYFISIKNDNFRVIDTAANQLTKTAITVTAIFILALGYELWHYLLAHLGVTEYIFFSTKQKVGKCLVRLV